MLPIRTLQGEEAKQVAPIVNTVALVLVTAKSPNWLAVEAPDPLPGRVSSVHAFSDVQPNTFAPAGALSIKNISPTAQTDGKVVPDLNGLVAFADEKSTSLL